MEDALISPEGFAILTGAGLIDASDKEMIVHQTEQTDKVTVGDGYVEIQVSQLPYVGANPTINTDSDSGTVTYTAAVDAKEDYIYVMVLDDNGLVNTEPYIAIETSMIEGTASNNAKVYKIRVYATEVTANASDNTLRKNDLSAFSNGCVVLVDYYHKYNSGAFQVDITPDKFGGNFYLEASTLFRDTNGVDMPAEFIIPNCKVQSNFTFTMASSGDPSTFTFTMDAFPDYTRWNKTKKVFAAIQIINASDELRNFERLGTAHNNTAVETAYNTDQKPYIEDIY